MDLKTEKIITKKQVIENRAILLIILCGRQNIVLRGNNDSAKYLMKVYKQMMGILDLY